MRQITKQSTKEDFKDYTGKGVVSEATFWLMEHGIIYVPEGSTILFLNGKVHNENGPAIFCKNETFSAFMNIVNDNPHPILPTLILEQKNINYIHFLNDKFEFHNLKGPAKYEEKSSEIFNEMYFINGKKIDHNDFINHPDVIEYNKTILKNKIIQI